MDDKTRGDDAQDHAPKQPASNRPAEDDKKQDAPNYDKRTDQGRAIKVDDMSSANDEGAN